MYLRCNDTDSLVYWWTLSGRWFSGIHVWLLVTKPQVRTLQPGSFTSPDTDCMDQGGGRHRPVTPNGLGLIISHKARTVIQIKCNKTLTNDREVVAFLDHFTYLRSPVTPVWSVFDGITVKFKDLSWLPPTWGVGIITVSQPKAEFAKQQYPPFHFFVLKHIL